MPTTGPVDHPVSGGACGWERASHVTRRRSSPRKSEFDSRDVPTGRPRSPNSTSLQVRQLGPDGELGGAPEDGLDVGVDDLDDPAGEFLGGEALGVGFGGEPVEGVADLVEALVTVGDVVVEGAEGVLDDRA